jgi:hypothetical protein
MFLAPLRTGMTRKKIALIIFCEEGDVINVQYVKLNEKKEALGCARVFAWHIWSDICRDYHVA